MENPSTCPELSDFGHARAMMFINTARLFPVLPSERKPPNRKPEAQIGTRNSLAKSAEACADISGHGEVMIQGSGVQGLRFRLRVWVWGSRV